MKPFFAILTVLLIGATSMTFSDVSTRAIGKWEVLAKDAPEGYQRYMVDIKKSGSTLRADIKGGEADLKDQVLTLKNNVLTASIYVGEYVELSIWEDKNSITGSAQTSSGKLSLVFKKVVKAK
ncbi:MAG: hypothetical protein KIT80_18650 [Chitinophagaceae bacterium]|nr:hypothetical protein [Chitinophagaceae bacterium]MCW5928947.1 hypothetical protein [Chitinophagaceae bacterium]